MLSQNSPLHYQHTALAHLVSLLVSTVNGRTRFARLLFLDRMTEEHFFLLDIRLAMPFFSHGYLFYLSRKARRTRIFYSLRSLFF